MTDGGQDYLLFRLYGPFASWGEIAVGEVRPSYERPSKSAVLGLVAAAKGLRRDDEEGQRRLAQDYGFAVEVQAFGHPLRDYHTVQRPPQRKGADYASRAAELNAVASDALATTLSYRDYWQDAAYVACLWSVVERPIFSLMELASALRQPHFVPYLGRKNCPLALPLQPQIVASGDVTGAFDGAKFLDADFLGEILTGSRVRYSEVPQGHGDEIRLIRRDQPASRRRWQFAEREEYRRAVP